MYALIPKEPISDQLVTEAKLNQEALDRLVDIALSRISRMVELTCGGNSDADDLIQKAIIQAVQNLGSYRGPNRFTAWLDRLTLNVIRMHFRKNAFRLKRTDPLDLNDVILCDRNTPELNEQNRQLYCKMASHIGTLKPKYRTAVVLSLVHEYSAKEVAALSGVSEAAAWKHIQRGFKALQKRIERDVDLKSMLKRGVR